MRHAWRPGSPARSILAVFVAAAAIAVAAGLAAVRGAVHPAATVITRASIAQAAMVLPAGCSAGTLVTVVAHLDDDLLFVNPGIADKLRAGWCIVTVHLIGGADNSKFDYVLTRERAIRRTYARMAGVRNAWTESTVSIAGKPVHRMVLDAMPHVALYELRLPGAQVRGGRAPLALLWDEGASVSSYPMGADGRGAVRYDRAALTATLGAILAHATRIYTLNPDTVPFLEHPDHIYAARATREAARAADPHIPISYHLTYVSAGMPANLSAPATQAKRDQVATYFAMDGGDIAQVFGEYEWNGNWVARRYAFDAPGGVGLSMSAVSADSRFAAPSPDLSSGASSGPPPLSSPLPSSPGAMLPAFDLVNVRSSRCLSSPDTNMGSAPSSAGTLTLATCDGKPLRAWRWRALPSYPGTPHNAALVSVASGRCVAERAGRLVDEPCDNEALAQRFTPWDFGIIRTPLGHCLGANGDTPALAACGQRTTAYRWTSGSAAPWRDLRLDGALYGDVSGTGKPSAVYIERRTDGPGFDIWVAPLVPGVRAVRWYANAVRFDADAIVPSCDGDALCFDSTRFVLGDFAGTGRADLMAIAPDANGGTAFWRFASTGSAFAAPTLWYRSDATLAPARAQQYVAGDFDGDGHADVLAAQRSADGRGFDFWLLTSRGVTGNAPSRWLTGVSLAPATQFFALRVPGSPRASLIAAQRSDRSLALAQWTSSGQAFSLHDRVTLPAAFDPAFTRIAAGPVDSSGLAGLALLEAHAPSPDGRAKTDVWTIAAGGPGQRFSAPLHIGTLGMPWTDALPALTRGADPDGKMRSRLVLFERTDAQLDEYHYWGGAPALSRYSIEANNHALGNEERLGPLPGRFTESLRLDRLQ